MQTQARLPPLEVPDGYAAVPDVLRRFGWTRAELDAAAVLNFPGFTRFTRADHRSGRFSGVRAVSAAREDCVAEWHRDFGMLAPSAPLALPPAPGSCVDLGSLLGAWQWSEAQFTAAGRLNFPNVYRRPARVLRHEIEHWTQTVNLIASTFR